MKWTVRFVVLLTCFAYLITTISCTHTSVRKTSPNAFGTQQQLQQEKTLPPVASKSNSSISAQGFIWPIEGEILSFFGERSGRIHQGIDIAAKKDASVRAAMSGKVVYSGSRFGGYGNIVIIDHGNEYSTAYAHNSKNLVSQNQQVNRGQVIALAGSTGNASSVHLHFEIRKGKKAVNPLLYLP